MREAFFIHVSMALYGFFQPLSSVCFERKTQFSVSQDLSLARSKYFKQLAETEDRGDVWSIKPPDFSPKLYKSVLVPQKRERKIHLNASKLQPSDTKKKTGIYLPNILHESPERKDPPEFITSYRPPDALESELKFVQAGKYPSETYRNPKPHNFRPVRIWKKYNVLYTLCDTRWQ